MLLRSNPKREHHHGCNCGCSSKVIHYPQVVKTVAPTSENGASEALKDLEQPSNGHNCPSERFEDVDGMKSHVCEDEHAERDYIASGPLMDNMRRRKHEDDCKCGGCSKDGNKKAQGDYNDSGKPANDSLENLYTPKPLTNICTLSGEEFEKYLNNESEFVSFIEGRQRWEKDSAATMMAMEDVGATLKQILRPASCCTCQIWGYHKTEGNTKLFATNSCGNYKLCFNCAMKRSRELAKEAARRITAYLQENPHLHMSMLVLTQPQDLSDEELIKRLPRALKKFAARIRAHKSLKNRSKGILSAIKGYTRALEVAKKHKKLHVHAHLLIFHDKFIKMAELNRIWAKCLGYKEVYKHVNTDIKRIVGSYELADGSDWKRHEVYKAIMECSKYVLKFSDLTPFDRVQVWKHTQGMRLFSYGGDLYNYKSPELPREELEFVAEQWEFYAARWNRNKSKYVVDHIADLSDSEQAQVRCVLQYGWTPPQLDKSLLERNFERITEFKGGNVKKITRPVSKNGITECRK